MIYSLKETNVKDLHVKKPNVPPQIVSLIMKNFLSLEKEISIGAIFIILQ